MKRILLEIVTGWVLLICNLSLYFDIGFGAPSIYLYPVGDYIAYLLFWLGCILFVALIIQIIVEIGNLVMRQKSRPILKEEILAPIPLILDCLYRMYGGDNLFGIIFTFLCHTVTLYLMFRAMYLHLKKKSAM